MDWFVLAFASMFCSAGIVLLVKKIADLGVRSDIQYFYGSIFAVLFVLIYILSSKTPLQIEKIPLLLCIGIGILAVIGNIFLIQSIKFAPNPGYSLAIYGLNILLVTIASLFLFKSQITLAKVVGVILAIAGIILLGL